MHTCAELIASVPFLEDAEDGFVRYLVTQLHPTVRCTASQERKQYIHPCYSSWQPGHTGKHSWLWRRFCLVACMIFGSNLQCECTQVISLGLVQVYLRNDMIIRTGELGREMFFIKAGAVQVQNTSHASHPPLNLHAVTVVWHKRLE